MQSYLLEIYIIDIIIFLYAFNNLLAFGIPNAIALNKRRNSHASRYNHMGRHHFTGI